MSKKEADTPSMVRSSAAEYLTFVAATGAGGVEALYVDESIWITQKMMATLYDIDVRTINYHLKKIFADSELQEDAVIRKFRITAVDGKSYNTGHYKLPAIIAVGYKVNSERAVQFRKWATSVISNAKTTCALSGHAIADHFPDAGKMIELALIRSKGDQALFGKSTQAMKAQWQVPDTRPLADFAPTIILKAKDFATEITIHNARTQQMQSEKQISSEHVTNNEAVRQTLLNRGIRPENLLPEEDVNKVERKLASADKKTLQNPDKLESGKAGKRVMNKYLDFFCAVCVEMRFEGLGYGA